MSVFKTFYWIPTIEDVEYFFHFIDIIHEYSGQLGVYNRHDSDDAQKIKLVIKMSNKVMLNTVFKRIRNRMTFSNLKDITQSEFLDANWIFIPDQSNQNAVREVRKLISAWVAGYDVFIPIGLENIVIIPLEDYLSDKSKQALDLSGKDNNDTKGRPLTFKQMRSVLDAMSSALSDITYFHSPKRWDAKIRLRDKEAVLITFSDISDENQPCEFNFSGDMELALQITQNLANACGNMVLDGQHMQPILIMPNE